ncbi:MAG: putative phage abortive infection protein [Pantoea agglomerans]
METKNTLSKLKERIYQIINDIDNRFDISWSWDNLTDAIIENRLRISVISGLVSLFLFLFIIGKIAWTSLFSEQTGKDILSAKAIGELGTFGDFFGGVTNPIIGAIGFIALTVTIAMQIKQNKETTKQNFENSVFTMLDLQNNIIDSLDYENSKSRMSFTKFLEMNQNEICPIKNHPFRLKIKISAATRYYTNFNSKHNIYFGHYFRNLFRILKMIDDSPYDYKTKRNYTRIIRAQLSMDELTVLFLNCLKNVCDNGEFSKLLIKYQMLEHLSIQKIGLDMITWRTFEHCEFIVGGKARVSYLEIAHYISKDSKNYYYKTSSGAFGSNTSKDLKALKMCMSKT